MAPSVYQLIPLESCSPWQGALCPELCCTDSPCQMLLTNRGLVSGFFIWELFLIGVLDP